jgi:hypothetical protein
MILKMDKNITHKFTEISPLNPDFQGPFFTILALAEDWFSSLPEEKILRTKYRVIIGD